MRQLPLWAVWLVTVLVAIGVYFALPSGGGVQSALYDLVGFSCVTALVVGVRRHRPARWSPWLLLAGGCFLLSAGDSLWTWYDARHVEAPFPGAADGLYLAGYLLLMGGVAGLLRRRSTRGGYALGLEAVIVALAMFTMSWQLFMAPIAHDTSMTVAARTVSLAYPALDVLLTAFIARLVMGGDWSVPAALFLILAMASTFVADVVYSHLEASGGYRSGDLVDLGWLLQYLLIGLAALHPSMARVGEPSRRTSPWSGARRLVVVAVAAAVAPVLLLTGGLAGTRVDVSVVAGSALVLVILVLLRMRAILGEAERWAAEVAHQARHDALTGLANRAQFATWVESCLRRDGDEVVVCFLDLDGFKAVNDTSGHLAGDDLLAEVAARLRAATPARWRLARLGGDEFGVLVCGPGPEPTPEEVGSLVLRVFEAPFEPLDAPLLVRCSIGVATGGQVGRDPALLLSAADVAMYAAKRAGKARWLRYEPSMDAMMLAPLRMQSRLEIGLADGELLPYYQVLADARTGRVVAVEALVRWARDGALVPPADFLSVAEASGLVVDVDRFMLDTACRDLAALRARRPWARDLRVGVNLSALSVEQDDLVPAVRRALRESGLSPDALVLEVTEGVLVRDPGKAAARLAELRVLGAAVALDDFGTGFSSLLYLQTLPVDVLKVPKPFIDPVGDRRDSETVLRAVVDLAHALGLRVTAEGVESEGQLEVLRAMGCEMVQGYLLAVPMPLEALEVLLDGTSGYAPGLTGRRALV